MSKQLSTYTTLSAWTILVVTAIVALLLILTTPSGNQDSGLTNDLPIEGAPSE